MLQKLLARFPWLEVCERIIYKDYLSKSQLFLKWYKKKKSKKRCRINQDYVWSNLTGYIDTVGINKGDIVIVHSSMDELKGFGKTCEEIIAYLLDLVGEGGTLVMPAFPYFKNKSQNKKLTFDEQDEEIKKYDPKQTYSWTGMLPNILCTYPNAVRSFFPNNSLVAVGKEAVAMMEHNLEGTYPHGRYSAWEYCAERDAKVLFLGASIVRSFTEVHLAEDYCGEEWPVEGWYKIQRYQIKTDDIWIEKEIKVRKQFWSRYVTEYYNTQQLKNAGLVEEAIVENIQIGYVKNIKAVRDYMIAKMKEGDLTFYKIPQKYWKKK